MIHKKQESLLPPDLLQLPSPHIKVWPAKRQHRPVGPRQQATLGKAETLRPLDAKHSHSAIDTFQASGIVWRLVSTLKCFLILSTGVPS